MENKKLNNLISRLRSDRANSVVILGLVIFVLILLMSGFIVDAAKNLYLNTNYTQMAQKATQTALKKQNNIGGLTPQAAKSVIDEYLELREPSKTKKCDGQVCATSETSSFRSVCANSGNYPKIKVSFSTDRNNKGKSFKNTVTYSNGRIDKDLSSLSSDFYRNQYRTIKVEIEDIGDNYFTSLFGGEQCPVFHIQTSSIAIDADAGQTGK